MVRPTLILLTVLIVPWPVWSEVVQCTASDGSVHYSDHGCPGETARRAVPIRPAPPSAAGAGAEQYSVMQQYRRLRESHDGSSARRQNPPHRALHHRALHQVDRVRLNEIEQTLRALESKERALRGARRSGSDTRRTWTREELAEVRAEIRSLKRQRENILKAR